MKAASSKAPKEVTRNNGPPSDGKYSVETLPDGKKYVRADRQVIFGNDPKSWSQQLEDYINGKIRRGQNVQLIADDGDVLITLTENTAGKVASRYKDGKTMRDEEYTRKVSAGSHIDELVQVSARGKSITADEDSRHGASASEGWNYRTAYFLDFDGKYYRCKISVSIGDAGNIVYNIGDMQERSFPTAQKVHHGSSANSGALGRETSSGSSIRRSSEDVKERFSAADDRILYLDEKRSQTHLPIVKGANYPTVGRKADFANNIRRFWENVKWKKSGKAGYTAPAGIR